MVGIVATAPVMGRNRVGTPAFPYPPGLWPRPYCGLKSIISTLRLFATIGLCTHDISDCRSEECLIQIPEPNLGPNQCYHGIMHLEVAGPQYGVVANAKMCGSYQ